MKRMEREGDMVRTRRTAWWMQSLDDRILEHLRDEGWSSPDIMADRVEFHHASEARIRERCRMLADIEFVSPFGTDLWEITQWGTLYLKGEVDAQLRPTPRTNRGWTREARP